MSDLELAPRDPYYLSRRYRVAQVRAARLPRRRHINFAELLTIMFVAAPVGIIGGLLWVGPALNLPRHDNNPALGLTIDTIERGAYQNTTRSFHDHYQMYMGVLDVLRYYPDP